MNENMLYEKIKIPTYNDLRGDLSVLELEPLINWTVKRIYYVTNTKLPRGGHCVKGERKIYIMCQGSCKAKLFDGETWFEEIMQGPGDGIILKTDMWREFIDFSEGSVMMALCNMPYDKDKYIMNIEEFKIYLKTIKIDG